MSRSTNHHGEASFSPEHYVFHGFFDNSPPFPVGLAFASQRELDHYLAEVDRYRRLLREHSDSVYPKVGRCAHCGTAIRYHVLYEDQRTGAIIAVGQTCAEERLERSPSEWKAYKEVLDAMRERARAGEKRIKLRDKFPEAVALLEECLSERAALDEKLDDRWEEDPNNERGNQDLFKEFFARWPAFVVDIAFKMQRYGDISERQAAAVVKWTAKQRERIAKRKELDASRAPLPDFGTERVEVEVRIISIQPRETAFGTSMKMLVEHADGWKLWGTCPNSLLAEDVSKGSVIAFSALIEASRDDSSFGFIKRPTKARIVERQEVEA